MRRPVSGPRCKHDLPFGVACVECQKETNEIKGKVQPLIDSYWDNKGKNAGNLNHLMYRAYKMGMKHDASKGEK